MENFPKTLIILILSTNKKIGMKGMNEMFDKIALALLIIGGLNWGLVGIFSFDLVAWLFGGTGAIISRIVYVAVALAAIWCITLLFRNERVSARS